MKEILLHTCYTLVGQRASLGFKMLRALWFGEGQFQDQGLFRISEYLAVSLRQILGREHSGLH